MGARELFGKVTGIAVLATGISIITSYSSYPRGYRYLPPIVKSVGDLNGDGVSDLLVEEPLKNQSKENVKRTVYMGLTNGRYLPLDFYINRQTDLSEQNKKELRKSIEGKLKGEYFL